MDGKLTKSPAPRSLYWLAAIALVSVSVPAPSGAVTITPIFDQSITSDPQAATIEGTIRAAIAVYEGTFLDDVVVPIRFISDPSTPGHSDPIYITVSYAAYYQALRSRAATADDATAIAHLPQGPQNPVNASTEVELPQALARALGLGTVVQEQPIRVGLQNCFLDWRSYDPNKVSLFGVVSHEIDEILGTGSALDGLDNGAPVPSGAIEPEDLFRYAPAGGVRSFNTDNAATAYFSVDGAEHLVRFNQVGQGNDFGDWFGDQDGSDGIPRVQDAFGYFGGRPELDIELTALDVIGYKRGTGAVWALLANGNGGTGKYYDPYMNLSMALQYVPVSGTVLFRDPGTIAGPLQLSTPVTIRAVGGPLILGR